MTKADLLEYTLIHIDRAGFAIHQSVHHGNPEAEEFDPTTAIAELSTAIDFLRRVKPVTADSKWSTSPAAALLDEKMFANSHSSLGLLTGVPLDVR